MRLIVLLLVVNVSATVWAQSNANALQPTNLSTAVTDRDSVSYSIIASSNNTFGYSIFLNRKLLIRQLHIPGVSGNKGFITSEEAAKVANLVINKIRMGTFPPTVSTKELKSLNITIR